MTQRLGNTRLKAARLAAGYRSQQVLAAAMNELGLSVGERQIRRWESDSPPWPHPDCQQALTQLLGLDMQTLGFTPPNGRDQRTAHGSAGRQRPGAMTTLAPAPAGGICAIQPASVADDFQAITHSHRHLYWSVSPTALHPAVIAHAVLGCALLPKTAGHTRSTVAAALAETWMLGGRIEFFDLREPERADATLLRALQAASEANDPLLGSAILAHTALIPGWEGNREAASERVSAARAYARRGPASAELWAWLDTVEAECETLCGRAEAALHLIEHAEDVLTSGSEYETPAWLDWFSSVHLAALKGNTQLKAGHLPQARETLTGALNALGPAEAKQSIAILGDLAAVESASGHPEEACAWAVRALDQLSLTGCATGMDRVREVRRSLARHQHEQCVRDLDERLYGWSTTIRALTDVDPDRPHHVPDLYARPYPG
ncbi:transcriptional regulator [Streptomyces albipurpureus]|uniref:Transcriptional regulator n=1 Tax=Streptomyces albipurpureus TaxID=2897419 RepID=A0ABT0V0U9_9ACTN|nr:transcriptional regulator [Streptomyces sp. CWNU-1]MCM2393026.1 transcriptional regulator [Streptomyces sp. CWNU-1]